MQSVPNDPQPQHLPTAVVAQTLAMSPSSVHRLVETGELVPVFRAPGIRGAMFFRRTDVAKLAKARQKAKVSA